VWCGSAWGMREVCVVIAENEVAYLKVNRKALDNGGRLTEVDCGVIYVS